MRIIKAIETDNLTKYYGKARGILDVSLSVEEGEFFGFIGPNGAGKSTTIRTLLGLIRPSGGSARLLGMDAARDRQAILAETGFLPAEASFYPNLRVRELLRFSADLRRRDCRQEAESLCARLQLDPNRRVRELSFGNRKKAAIVCALQHRPRLLILDEPTSGLDPLMQREFFAILRERSRAGATVFLSSHVLSEVQQNCSRAAVIREGRIIACDRMDALRGTRSRRVCFRGEADLSALPAVRDLRRSGDGTVFLYDGETDALLRTLSAGRLTDLTIAEPGLDEVFLHFYQEGGADA